MMQSISNNYKAEQSEEGNARFYKETKRWIDSNKIGLRQYKGNYRELCTYLDDSCLHCLTKYQLG